MATSKISLDTGSTLHTATYTVSEDALTKHIPRSVLSDSAGAEKGVAANPLFTAPSGGTITSLGSITGIVTITGSTVVVGSVTITGSTSVVNVVSITGSTSVINTVAITGSTSVINTVAVTGSVVAIGGATEAKQPSLGTAGTASTNVITVQGIAAMTPILVDGSAVTQPVSGTVTVTGSTAVVGTVTITGSTSVVNTVTVTGSTAVINTVTITGSTSVVNTVAITGSTTIVGTVTVTGSTTAFLQNDMGRSLLSAVGALAATNGTLVASASGTKIKVYAFSLSTTSSTQQLAKFQSAVGGTDLWAVALMAPTGSSNGANLAVTPPAYLFATPSTSVLNLNLSSTNAVHWTVSYFIEA